MKKILSILLICTIVLGFLAGCQKTEPVTPEVPRDEITTAPDDTMKPNDTNKPTDANNTTPNTTPKPEKPTEPAETPPKLSGSLEDIINNIYALIPEKERPNTMKTPISNDSADNKEFFLGTSDITITEGMGSEPMISSVAHSLVLIRVPDGIDIKATMDKITKSVDPRKWICVEVKEENVKVVNYGNIIMLIMADNSQAYVDAFNSLAK